MKLLRTPHSQAALSWLTELPGLLYCVASFAEPRE